MHATLKKRNNPSSHLRFYELGNVQGIYAECKTPKYLEDIFNENRKKYSKQWNYCASLPGNIKQNWYINLNEKSITSNKKF